MHDADASEPHPFVAADGGGVVEGRIDGDPVVPAIVGEVVDQGLDRVRPDPLPMLRRVDEEVDRGVPVVGVRLLGEVDQSDDAAVDDDR